MSARVKGVLAEVRSPDEGLALWPFSFTINGTSDPDGLVGDELVSASRTSAGKFTLTLRDRPVAVIHGGANVVATGDSTDLYAQTDVSTLVSAGTVVVKTKTGSTNTDPADNTVITGLLVVKKTSRKAR